MKRTSVTSAGAILAIVLVLTACGGTDANGGGNAQGTSAGFDRNAVLRWAVPGMPTSFDPRKSAPLDPVFLDVVYESLVNRTPAGELVPGLATEWKLGDDNTTITFTLRPGVKFHNGEAFDGEAVKANLEAFKKEGALAGTLAGLDKVDVLAPDQVRLTFAEPSGYMINVLAGEAGIVVAPSALGDPGLTGKPVGTGPFQLDVLGEGKVTFKRFDGYWDAGRITLGGIEMAVYSDESTRLRAVKSGQADGTSITPSQIKESEAAGLTVIKGANTTFNGILINTSSGKLTDPKVREAMLYAIDRASISKNLYAGVCTPAVQPLQQGFWANVPELNDVTRFYDTAKAKQLLTEAGYPDGFDMQLEVGPNTSYQTLAQALQAQLQQVGIRVTIKVLEFQQMVNARRTGNFTATVSLLQAGRPDPSQFVADFYLKGGLYNPGGFELPGGADLLAESRVSADVAERAAPLQEIFKQVLEAGPPVVPVCGITYVAAFRKGVTGMEVPVTGDYDFAPIKITS